MLMLYIFFDGIANKERVFNILIEISEETSRRFLLVTFSSGGSLCDPDSECHFFIWYMHTFLWIRLITLFPRFLFFR